MIMTAVDTGKIWQRVQSPKSIKAAHSALKLY